MSLREFCGVAGVVFCIREKLNEPDRPPVTPTQRRAHAVQHTPGKPPNSMLMIPSPPEQRQIAELLSSLNTLLAVEDEKLAALEAHKKGLTQQLFPIMSEANV